MKIYRQSLETLIGSAAGDMKELKAKYNKSPITL
jgi:hypothetical protein